MKEDVKLKITLWFFCIVAAITTTALGFGLAMFLQDREDKTNQEAIGIYYTEYDDMEDGEYIILSNRGGGLRYVTYSEGGEPYSTTNPVAWKYLKDENQCRIGLINFQDDSVYTFNVDMHGDYFTDESGAVYHKIQ